MKAMRLLVLLGAILLTGGELLAVDYSTAPVVTDHTSQPAPATLIAQR